MKNTQLIKAIGVLSVAGLLSLSQAVLAEINISGWINEGIILYDDGQDEETVQATDNGTTLASRITFAGSTEIGTGETGFEVILEPRANVTPLIFSNQSNFDGSNGHDIGVLGNSLYVKGAAGKLTVGLQSMPTDNIAVLEDPSLTLWSGISPVFRGNGFTIRGVNGAQVRVPGQAAVAAVAAVAAMPAVADDPLTLAVDESRTAVPQVQETALAPASNFSYAGDTPVWGDFLNCFTASGLRGAGGIGIDCNGIYRQGVRYDLPTFGPISVAVGWANSEVYDIAAKYKGNIGRISSQFAIGWSINNAANGRDGKTGPDDNITNPIHYDEADNLQFQIGLMDPITGLFGSFAYQHEGADLVGGDASNLVAHIPVVGNQMCPMDKDMACTAPADVNAHAFNPDQVGTLSDESDAWWFKVGIKKQFFSIGETSFAFDFGIYEDQYGFNEALNGVTGSEVERIGFSVDQYFGKSLIVYGKWEQLEIDVDGTARANAIYGGGDELSTLVLGGTYFF